MNYKFKIENISNSKYYFIELNDMKNYALGRFSDFFWTPTKAQSIIDAVERNRTLASGNDPYIWGNEDVIVFANELGVLLIDQMAARAKQETIPLELTHEEFITFMQDFKKFIEENQ
jgi:hypothetical protein